MKHSSINEFNQITLDFNKESDENTIIVLESSN
jgi:hypothetical protein